MPRDYYERSPPTTSPVATDSARPCSKSASTSKHPTAAYYVMADITAFGATDDVAFARHLVREVGVATVPGSSFFRDKELGRQFIRFCFCKRDATLDAAIERLRTLEVMV